MSSQATLFIVPYYKSLLLTALVVTQKRTLSGEIFDANLSPMASKHLRINLQNHLRKVSDLPVLLPSKSTYAGLA